NGATIDLDPTAPGPQSSQAAITGQGRSAERRVGQARTFGQVLFTPTPGFMGPATVTYTIADSFGSVSNVATLTVTVAPPGAPVATDDSVTTLFNTPVAVPVAANDLAAAGASLDSATIDLDPATPVQQSSRAAITGQG